MDKTDSIGRFLQAVAARTATPGGGSVSAFACSVGAALGCMTAHYSLPKSDTTPGVMSCGFESAGERMLQAVFDDAAAYDKLAAAFKLPKGTEEEMARRLSAIDAGSRAAAEVPLTGLRMAKEILAGIVELAESFNKNLATDLSVGAIMTAAGARGLRLNVAVNLDGITDRGERARLAKEAAELEKACLALEKEVLAKIWASKRKRARS